MLTFVLPNYPQIKADDQINIDDFVPIKTYGIGAISDLTYSPNGSELAISGLSDSVFIFSTKNYSLNRKFDFYNRSIYTLCWHPDGKKIALGMDNEIRIIDYKTGRKIRSIDYSVNELRWSRDGKKIFASNNDGLKIFYANNGSLIRSVTDGTVRAWNPDENLVAVAHKNNITLINVTNGKFAQVFSVKINDNFTECHVYNPTWSPDGKKIAYIIGAGDSHNGDYRLQVLNYSSGKIIGTSQISNKREDNWYFQWSPDSRNIVGTIFGNKLIWFDISNISNSGWLSSKSYNFGALPSSWPEYGRMSWSSDGRYLAVEYSDLYSDINIKIIDTESFSVISSIENMKICSHSSSDVTWSPNDEKIAVCCGKELKIIDVKTWEIKEFNDTSLIHSVDWSSDRRKIVYSVGENVNVINVTDGSLFMVFHHPNSVIDAIWSPDGSKIAVATKENTVVWDLESNDSSPLFIFNTTHLDGTPIAFSPDGCKLASGSKDGNITIWNISTGKLIRTISVNLYNPNYGPIRAVAWSPDGDKIAGSVGPYGYDFVIWNAYSGKELKFYSTGSLHLDSQATIKKIEWSPDSEKIATLGVSSWIIIWDYDTNHVKILSVHYPSEISAFSWSHDGDEIVTVTGRYGLNYGGKIRIWGSPADLKVKDIDVIPTKDNITLGENLTIYTTIINEGKEDATNFWVDLYVDDVKIYERKISFISKEGGTVTLQTNFTPSRYSHKIDVIVDSDGFVPEFNKGNNYASKVLYAKKEDSINYFLITIVVVSLISLITTSLLAYIYVKRKV
ncbi:MAG: PD40 domain-containing protein [Thermoplasmata archaeon]|nr:PD40 domain-containing protein [Thermoplasmata archaeon]